MADFWYHFTVQLSGKCVLSSPSCYFLSFIVIVIPLISFILWQNCSNFEATRYQRTKEDSNAEEPSEILFQSSLQRNLGRWLTAGNQEVTFPETTTKIFHRHSRILYEKRLRKLGNLDTNLIKHILRKQTQQKHKISTAIDCVNWEHFISLSNVRYQVNKIKIVSIKFNQFPDLEILDSYNIKHSIKLLPFSRQQ